MNIYQIPIDAKIIKLPWKKNDVCNVVVECSDMESTKGSDVVRNGLTALRYLWVGSDNKSELASNDRRTIEDVNIIINASNEFFVLFFLVLLYWIKEINIKNKNDDKRRMPEKLLIKLIPGLSKTNKRDIKESIKTEIFLIISFLSSLVKINEKT